MIGEAIFKTSADISVSGAVHVPSATAADQNIGSEVQGQMG